MARIQSVNYRDIPKKVEQMKNDAIDLNKEISNSYAKIDEMRVNWYGVRYNVLISQCNNAIDIINKLLNLVVKDIPSALNQIANNYSMADSGRSIPMNEAVPKQLSPMLPSSEETMKFMTEEVTNTQTAVNSSFSKALVSLENYQTIYNSLDWKSEAADSFREKFNTLKDQVKNALENIQTSFAKLMEQALDDIRKAEQNNTVQ